MSDKGNHSVSRRDALKSGAGIVGATAIVGMVSGSSARAADYDASKSTAPIPKIITGPVEVWKTIPIPEQLPATEGYADTKPVKIWYWDTGGNGEAIVLCHPGSQSSECWKYQQPVFAKAGYRVIAWSMRGTYKTEQGPADQRGSSAEDLDKLMEFLGIDKFHLVGCAGGGMTAISYALYRPEKLHSLVLSGSFLLPDEAEFRTFVANSASAAPGKRANVPVEYSELCASYRAGNPEGLAKWRELNRLAHPGGGLGGGQTWGPVPRNWTTFANLTVPVLLQTGDADMSEPPSLLRLFVHKFPNCEKRVIEEAGHSTYWEQPEAFNANVLEWVGRHSPRN